MGPVLRTIHRTLAGKPPAFIAGVALSLVALLGLADLATGAELSSSVFYAAPVAIAAWYGSRHLGTALSLAASGTWYLADLLAGATYSAPWIPFWNAGVRLGFFLIIAGLLVRLRDALEAQRALAEIDGLTGLANSRRFLQTLGAEVSRAARYRHPVSLAYIDLDGFKEVNDRQGHAAGDAVLSMVGSVLRASVRASDLPARMGGDEFAVLLPETDEAQARDVATKLRTALEQKAASAEGRVGFSMGVITSPGPGADGEELVRRADHLMYDVKRTGKGRTTFAVLGEEG